jgi:hypothetical protein
MGNGDIRSYETATPGPAARRWELQVATLPRCAAQTKGSSAIAVTVYRDVGRHDELVERCQPARSTSSAA